MNETNFSPERIAELKVLSSRTHAKLLKVIHEDKCQFSMHIPARPEQDFDLLVGDTTRALSEALTEIERLNAEYTVNRVEIGLLRADRDKLISELATARQQGFRTAIEQAAVLLEREATDCDEDAKAYGLKGNFENAQIASQMSYALRSRAEKIRALSLPGDTNG
jgi:hypothetical protein